MAYGGNWSTVTGTVPRQKGLWRVRIPQGLSEPANLPAAGENIPAAGIKNRFPST
jgi:hypothetical protein